MVYAGFTLLVLFIFSTLFIIGTLIYECHREQYILKSEGTGYNYLGKIRDFKSYEVLYILQSSENGGIYSINLETLNKYFKKQKINY